ncbi:TetR/AcrR family transcriptional regulator [Slackia heliotrinireducens]|uniref:Transcriptional regulator n=1 Tax=Slackia heliotrinireducens (strain ATCC 29202 / DSM 20476 / NCTC 11029 / RHS 1) TaxID=471855 RepID=C7N3V4_SLAHD|nr:TetR/AcrR family transcriptional regulator [Slackia heliotrinireducens]ACV21695.1 transcriptional regulator [Slackia heliotrinireducens DSM 20476]VEG99329.1 HTH-type dhaKLM operon transcriptional activator dhaS [Slackia heliotrinireducens]
MKDSAKTDKRVMRTRKAIGEAFARLLETTEYSKVTVSAIAREADVNRKTFYLHYDSVEDVLAQLLEERIAEIVESDKQLVDCEHVAPYMKKVFCDLLTMMDEAPIFRDNVIKYVSYNRLLDMAKDPILENIHHQRQALGMPKRPDIEYVVTMYLGGLYALYETWSHDEATDMTLENLAETACGLLEPGVREMLNEDRQSLQ